MSVSMSNGIAILVVYKSFVISQNMLLSPCSSRYAIETIYQNKTLLPGTRIGMIVLGDCTRHGLSIVRSLQIMSELKKGPMPGPLAPNITSSVLGILGPMDGDKASVVGHIARVYNVPMIAVRGALNR